MNSFKVNYLIVNEETKGLVEYFISEWFNNNEYITVLTSGSTGIPKPIQLLKSKMKDSALMTGHFLNLKEHDKALLCLSVNTIAGKMMIVRSIVLKLNLYICSPTSDPLNLISEEIDFIAMVPMQLDNTLNLNSIKLKKIRNVIIGGGIISTQIIDKLIANNITVFHTYGMTETISHIAMRRVGLHSEDFFTAIGLTFFSENNGQLIIHSPIIESESITTTDVVQLIDNKHFVFKGRSDFVINSGGVKIQAEDVEHKIEKLIPYPFFITGIEDPSLGEKVVLLIENKDDIHLNKIDLLELTSKYECPKEIYFISKFELTELGKINRLKTISKINKNTTKIIL